MNYESIIENLKCPISHQIFRNPVVAMDGITYEKEEIIKWFRKKSTSPMTGKNISNTLIDNYCIKSIIEHVVNMNKELLKDQYPYVFSDYLKGNCKIMEIEKFDWKDFYCFKYSEFKTIFSKMTDDEIKHIIDHSINLEERDNDGWTPINFAIDLFSFDIVKYLVEKNVNLENKTKEGRKPIHIACCNKKIEILKLLIDKNVDLESVFSGKRPVHMIKEHCDLKTLKYIMDKGVNLD